MKLSAASMTLYGLPQHASATEVVVAAANQARAGDPLQAIANTQRECRLNPSKPAESSMNFGYGDH